MHKLKGKIDYVLEKALILVETLIAIISTVILVGLLVVELYHIFTDPAAFFGGKDPVTDYLHHMLTIVIGLEFVKLLMHLTPANILEVLTMAISRGIIVNHGTALENLLSIACIIGMFAARRFLIPRAELHKELDEEVPEHHHHRGQRRHKHKNAAGEEHKEAAHN